MQIRVSGHTVCLPLLRNQSLKTKFTYRIECSQQAAPAGSFEFQTYAQVFKIITWEEVITDRTVLDIKADLVPKEYHNLSL